MYASFVVNRPNMLEEMESREESLNGDWGQMIGEETVARLRAGLNRMMRVLRAMQALGMM